MVDTLKLINVTLKVQLVMLCCKKTYLYNLYEQRI